MKKRLLTMALALCMLLSLLPVGAAAADIVDSGTCGKNGDNLTWTLDSNGLLTISGTGEMADYSNNQSPFSCNDSIKTVVIKPGVASIGANAFYGCSSLTSITIPDSVTEIAGHAFQDCRRLTRFNIPDGVTRIEDYTFSECWSLTGVTIPDSVTSIGEWAFSDCGSLTGITIPDSVTSIGEWAFISCGLTSITIPDNVMDVGPGAFDRCDGLAKIEVGPGNKTYSSMGGVLFSKDQKTLVGYPAGSVSTSYTIPDSVTCIGDYAFSSCKKLTSITIPDSVTSIGEYAFADVDRLTSIDLPGSVTNLGEGAFYACDKLTSITIPDSVTSIGEKAFLGCESLTGITIPDSVTSIEWATFDECSSLTSIHIPDSVTSIGTGAFEDCISLTSITIPDSVTIIEGEAFAGCSSLTSIDLPSSMTRIEWSTFSGCSSLADITIPDGVTEIRNNAFYGCDALSDVYFNGTKAQWDQIRIRDDNEPLLIATIHFLSDSSDSGNDTSIYTRKIKPALTVYASHSSGEAESFALCSGATVTYDGQSYQTEQNGAARLSYLGGVIGVFKDQFLSVTIPEIAIRQSSKVYLYKKSDAPTVYVVRMDGKYNILNETREVPLVDSKKHKLHVEVDWGKGSQKSLKLVQEEKSLDINVGDSSIVWSDHFDLSKPIYIVAENDQAKNSTTRQKLQLSVRQAKLSGFSLKFDDSMSCSLPDFIPGVGGEKLKTGIYAHVPIHVTVEGEKIYAAIGLQIDGSDDFEEDGPKIKTFAESLKKLKKNYGSKKAIQEFFKKNKKKIAQGKGSWGVDAGFQVAGFYEGYFDTKGKLHALDKGLYFKIDASVSYSQPIAILGFPCYLEGKFSGEVEALLNLYLSEAAKKFMPDGTMEGKLALSVGGGAGVNKLASFGGGFTGALNQNSKYDSGSLSYAKVNFTLNGYFKATALGLEWEHPCDPFVDVTLYEYPETKSARSMQSDAPEQGKSLYDASAYAQPDLSYLDAGSRFLANAPSGARALGVTDAPGVRAQTFAQNSYQNAAPQIVNLEDGGKLAVWTGYDPARTGMDRLCLWYSYFNGAAWTDPAIVDDDGTMDANFSLLQTNGGACLVWMNADGSIAEDAGLQDVAAQMDISAAVFDAENCSFTITRLTAGNHIFENMPTLCTDYGTVTAVWVQNADNAVLEPTDANSICASDLTDGAWSEPTVLYTDLSALDSIAADRSWGDLNVAYSMDLDGDLNTAEDLEVYTNGDALTENDGMDSGVQYVNGTLYWYQAGTLVADGEPVIGAENGFATDRYQVVDDNGVKAVVFARSTGVTSALSAVFYDDAAGAWGDAVDLTDDAGAITSFSAIATEEGLCALFNRAALKESDYVESSLELLDLPLHSDLALDQVLFDSAEYLADTPLSLTLALSNSGAQAVHGFTVTIQNSAGETMLTQELDDVLLPGADTECTVKMPVAQTSPSETVTVTVTANEDDDPNAGNNSQTITIEQNDLTVENPGWGVNENGKLVIYADIVNRGYTPSGTQTVLLRKDAPDGAVLERKQISGLNTLDLEHVSFETNDTQDAVYFVELEDAKDGDVSNNSDVIVVTGADAIPVDPTPTTEPTTEPTTSPDDPTPTTKPDDPTPTTKPDDPKPTTKPDDPKPTTEPTKPTTEPTKPTTEPTKPTTEPTKPTTKPDDPTPASPQPTTKPDDPKPTPKPIRNPFVDVNSGDYFYDPVLWALTHEPQITDGMTETTFAPGETCTRGQVVTFLWRAMGCAEPKSASNPFNDVAGGDYFYKAVLWAVEKGITDGTSATTFSPNDPCTRAHVVTFLHRAEGTPAAGSKNPFSDVAAGEYYTDAVLWAVSKGITDGTSDTTFSPADPCTRGQIVTFLYRDMK